MNAPDDTHAPFCELLALRLYDELDAEEHARLDAHLAGCADCTRLGRELEAGLGKLRPDAVTPIAAPTRGILRHRVAAAAALVGFAAGALFAWTWSDGDERRAPQPVWTHGPDSAFGGASGGGAGDGDGPPLATSRGRLTRLARQL